MVCFSGDASKLKILAKNILSHVVVPSNHLRESRLKALTEIGIEDLRTHVHSFLAQHSLEALFYGNLTVTTANKMANSIILARRDFLEKYVKIDGNSDQDLVLEDWFKNDPVNQIAILELNLIKSKGAGESEEGENATQEHHEETGLADAERCLFDQIFLKILIYFF